MGITARACGFLAPMLRSVADMGHMSKTETIKAAKKPHRCTWCWTRIAAGESYKRYRWFGGDTAVIKMHPECYRAMLEVAADEGGEIEWVPGQPRGCSCEWDRECVACKARELVTPNKQGEMKHENQDTKVH